jgi:tetraacyldisaccharide 4'-kinase
VERWLMARWFGGVAPNLVLRALSGVYGQLMRFRRTLYRRGVLSQHRFDVPVIVVGNRTVGGAGKTPVVIALVSHLQARGIRVGVVSRGYGRKYNEAISVSASTLPDRCGDEPLLIHRSTGAPVEVDTDRVAAARRLIASGCTVVVADDGLQHLRLGRSLEIEVQDSRGLGNGRVLPAGPLREPVPERSVAERLVHGRAAQPGEMSVNFELQQARRLVDGAERPLSEFVGAPIHAVAGIGDPKRFFDALRAHGLTLMPHAFPDHHSFVAADLSSLVDAPVLMTGKDAVKCAPFATENLWEVPLQAKLPEDFLERVALQLQTPVRYVTP